MSNRDLEKVAYRVAELTRGVEGLTRARQVARSIVSGKVLDDLVKDAESAQDRLDTQDELINEIGDAADWWVPSAELTADASDEAHEAKMQALESLSDAIAALDGIENLEEELTDEIAAAQAAADAAATEANLAKLQALQNVQDILTLSSEQAVIADEARDAWNAAVQAGQDAATAAGIAAGKGKTIIQSATPSEEDRLPQNLWIDTTGGANTPKRWSGSAWVAVSDKVAVDAAAAAVAAQSAADAAAAAAASAGQAATQAQTTANGKTKLVRSTAAASGQGTTVGDVWWRFGNAQFTGPVTGQWTWSGSAWVPSTIGSEIIEALTVDKLAVTGGAKIPTAVIDTLVGDQAFFTNLLAKKLVVSSESVVPFSPGMGLPVVYWLYGGVTVADHVQDQGRPVPFYRFIGNDPGKTGTWGRMAMLTGGQVSSTGANNSINVRGGDKFSVSAVVGTYASPASNPAAGDNNARIEAYFYLKDGTGIAGATIVSPVAERLSVGGVPIEWQFTVPADAAAMRIYLATTNWTSSVTLMGLSVRPQVGAVLIEDGAVTAPKITASSELSAKVAEFIKVKASQLVADNAAMNAAFIKQLVGDDAFYQNILASRLVIAGANRAFDPYYSFAGKPGIWSNPTAGAGSGPSTDQVYPGGTQSIKLVQQPNGTSNMSLYAPQWSGSVVDSPTTVAVQPGEKLVATTKWWATAKAPNNGNGFATQVYFRKADGTTTAANNNTAAPNRMSFAAHPVGEWFETGGVVTAPADAAWAIIRPTVYFTAGTTRNNAVFYVGYNSLVPQVGAVLIEDGAVTADKIRADAIDGKTITGATVRTSASGQRMQFDVNGLRAFNSSGGVTASLAADGEGMSLYGVLGDTHIHGNSLGVSRVSSNNTIASLDIAALGQSYGTSLNSLVTGSAGWLNIDSTQVVGTNPVRYQPAPITLKGSQTIIASEQGLALSNDTNWANFTRASGMSGTAQWRRYLGVIYVRMNITTTVATGDHVQLGTLPAAARPSEPTALNASGTAGPICTAYVDTGGVIRFRNANNHTATAPYVDGCFLAKDI